MKTRASLFLLLVAAIAGAFWFSGSVSATEKTSTQASHNIVIDRGGIVIPGTSISTADREAMNTILNKYDKSLYRINTYENGKLQKTQGKLTDVVTDKQVASEIAMNVKRSGFTQSTVQIRTGATNNPNTATNPSPNPGGSTNNPQKTSSGGSPNNPQKTSSGGRPNNPNTKNSNKKSDELVESLTPILKKYQKK